MKKKFYWQIRLMECMKIDGTLTKERVISIRGMVPSKVVEQIKKHVGGDLTKYELNKEHQITIDVD